MTDKPVAVVTMNATLWMEACHVVAMHREMCEAIMHGGTPSAKKLKGDFKLATEILALLREHTPEFEGDSP